MRSTGVAHPRRPPTSSLAALLEEAFPAPGPTSDPDARLRVCLARRDGSERVRITDEVHELLGRGLCDMQMSDVIAFELGCHLRPADMGLTPSEWLAWVGRRAECAP